MGLRAMKANIKLGMKHWARKNLVFCSVVRISSI